jgi:excisionase family DNA binding protein
LAELAFFFVLEGNMDTKNESKEYTDGFKSLGELFNIPAGSIRIIAQRQGWPALRIGKHYRFNREEVLAYLSKRQKSNG